MKIKLIFFSMLFFIFLSLPVNAALTWKEFNIERVAICADVPYILLLMNPVDGSISSKWYKLDSSFENKFLATVFSAISLDKTISCGFTPVSGQLYVANIERLTFIK